MSERKRIVGVGLFLFYTDSHGQMRIMVAEEMRAKPLIGKRIGMQSFPLETQEPADQESVILTMQRCASEELGISPDQMTDFFPVAMEFRLFPEVEEIDIITRYGIARYVGIPECAFCSSTRETQVVGWMTVPELLKQPLIRVETQPICEHFLREMPHRQGW